MTTANQIAFLLSTDRSVQAYLLGAWLLLAMIYFLLTYWATLTRRLLRACSC